MSRDIQPDRYTRDCGEHSDFCSTHYDYSPVSEYLDTEAKQYGFTWRQASQGVFMIEYKGKSYRYWPKTGKWCVRGSGTVYKSKSIDQFMDKYVLRDVNKNHISSV